MSRALIACGAVVAWFVLCSGALAQQAIDLDYEPKKGDSTVYDLQVHASATDKSGIALVSHITSTIKLEIVGIKRDAENNIDGAVIEISQKDASAKFVSGENEKTVPVEDSILRVETNKDGEVTNVPAGSIEKSFTDSIASICAKLSQTERPARGDQWKAPVTFNLMGDTVTCEVTYVLVGRKEIAGEQSVLISSSGVISHKFKKKGPIKSLDMSWNGQAYYGYERGRFERIVVRAAARGVLEDDTPAEIAEFSLQITPRKEEAAVPRPDGDSVVAGFFGGGNIPRLPIFLCAAILLGFVAVRMRRQVLRKALICGLAAVVVMYGMPFGRAQAASPAALTAFSNVAIQILYNSGALTAAGGAGVGISGTKASSLASPYAAVPAWAGSAMQDASDDLPEGFVQLTGAGPVPPDLGPPVGGARETAGGGVLTATNMLIGGGVLAASAGAGIAAAQVDGGGGAAPCTTTSLPTPDPTDLTEVTVIVKAAGTGYYDTVAPDVVTVLHEGSPVAGLENVAIDSPTKIAFSSPAVTLLDGPNEFRVVCVDGGGNTWAIIDFIIAVVMPEGKIIKICQGSPATITVTKNP